MKSITIHGLDEKIYKIIKEKAKIKNFSLNKEIKLLLYQALGIDKKKEINHRDEFLDMFGIWEVEENIEFLETQKDFSKIDEEDWL